MEKFGSSPEAQPEQRLGSAPYSVGGSAYNGICPSCGYPREHAADQYCELCTTARRDERERECPATLPALVRRAMECRPGNEDRIRGCR